MIFTVEKVFISNINCFTSINKFISDNLKKAKVDDNLKNKYLLVIESIINKVIEADGKNQTLTIKIKSTLNKTHVEVSAQGPQISENIKDIIIEDYFPDEILENADISDFALSTLGLEVSTKYKNNLNIFKITNLKSQRSRLRKTLTFMLAGAACGLLLRFLPHVASDIIAEDVFSLVYDLFLNAIKLCLTPLIFLSISTSIASYSNIGEVKKVAVSTLKVFVCFTLVTLAIGFTAFILFPISDPSLQAYYTEIAGEININTSVEDVPDMIAETIRLLVPTNIITPFSESIITQTIFLSILVGIALLLLGERGKGIARALKKLEMLVNKIIAIIISFLPIAVFCSIASTCITLEASSFLTILKWIALLLGCFAALIVFYIIAVTLFSNVKLKDFISGILPVSTIAFTLASSGAAMPQSVKACIEKFKVPRKIATFTVPLGTTINLNGTMMNVIVSSLFLLTLSGIQQTPLLMGIFFINMFILAMGTPAIPGGGIVLISTIIASVGIPTDCVNLLVGIYPLIDMVQSAVNVTATGAATVVATKSIQKKYPEYKN